MNEPVREDEASTGLGGWIERHEDKLQVALVLLIGGGVVAFSVLSSPDVSVLAKIVVWIAIGLLAAIVIGVALKSLAEQYESVARWIHSIGLLAIVAAVGVAPTVVLARRDQLFALKLFAIVVLAMIPGFIYLHFLAVRGRTLREEYLRNLVRLGLLPTTRLADGPDGPRNSDEVTDPETRFYLKKFEAVYGRRQAVPGSQGPSSDRSGARRARGNLAPMLWLTVTVAVGWALVLEPEVVSSFSPLPDTLVSSGRPEFPVEALKYAFLGTYFFIVQMLVRRSFQDDLKANAYLHGIVRIISAVFVVAVVGQIWPSRWGEDWLLAFSFFVGIFPQMGLDLIRKGLQKVVKVWVPGLDVAYPLSDLDGLNVFYEARLLEEGIEDMQNLASADIVELMLRTRVPVERLIDWIDQAHLLLRLDLGKQNVGQASLAATVGGLVGDRDEAAESTTPVVDAEPASGIAPSATARDRTAREILRQHGIRTATGLQDAYGRVRNSAVSKDPFITRLDGLLPSGDGPSRLRTILVTLKGEPNLRHVRAWRDFEPARSAAYERAGLAAELAGLPDVPSGRPETAADRERFDAADVALTEFVAQNGVRELGPDAGAGLLRLAAHHAAAGQTAAALDRSILATLADDKNPNACCAAAELAIAVERDDQAAVFVSTALTRSDDDDAARTAVVESTVRAAGDPARAMTLLREVLRDDEALVEAVRSHADGDGPLAMLAQDDTFRDLVSEPPNAPDDAPATGGDGDADGSSESTDSPASRTDDAEAEQAAASAVDDQDRSISTSS